MTKIKQPFFIYIKIGDFKTAQLQSARAPKNTFMFGLNGYDVVLSRKICICRAFKGDIV